MNRFKDMSDFQLANFYFNCLQYKGDEEEKIAFFGEVDKRRGGMLISEWLDYNY